MIGEKRSWNHRYVTLPIMLFMILFLWWSIVTDVDEVVRGHGKVIPSSQTKVLQHLEGGIIKEIYVQEGERVEKGAPIYRLKNATSQADSNQKEITLLALKAQRERLNAQVNFSKLSFSQEIEDAMMAGNEKKIFRQEMQNFNDELSTLKDRVSQSKLEKKKKAARLKNLQAELKTAKENLAISQKLLKSGAASKRQYLEVLAKKQAIMTQISDIKGEIPIMIEKISEGENKIQSFHSESKSKWLKKLSEVETKIKKLSEESHAQSDREERKIVTSPVNGIVQKLYFHTLGGVVKAGDKIAEITPLDDTLIIKANIKTNDRGDVLLGQDVSIEITAYNYAKFGLLKGELLSISPDSFEDRDGSSHYEVKVKAKKSSFAKDKPIMPGMVANINILTGKKTIMEYLLKPMKDISHLALHEK